MKSRIQLFSLLVIAFLSVFAQSPEGFNYQAVVRNNSGEVLANQNVGIRITLIQGAANGTTVYRESFTKTTNSFGLIDLVVGQGNVTNGSFSTIDWGSGPYFLETAIDQNGGSNYVVLGTTQLMSVPFAMYAASAANDGLDGQDGVDGKSAYQIWLDAGNTGTEEDFLESLVGEGRAPQDIFLSGTSLSISEGSTVDLAGIDTDTKLTEVEVDDLVSNNGYLTSETQDLSLSGSDLSISGGSTIDLSTLTNFTDTNTQLSEQEVDAFVANNGYLTSEQDGDATNEIQDLNLSGNTLTITNNSNATAIDLAPFSGTNTDNQDLQLNGTTLSLSGDPDNTSVDLSSFDTDTRLSETEVDDFVDNNGYLTAEVQDITLSGSSLSITGGSSIDLSSLTDFTDTNTQLSEAEVDAFVENNGYLTSFTEVDGDVTNELQDISLVGTDLSISNGSTVDLSGIDTNTQLSELEVDAFVANNGYLTSFTEVDGDATNELQTLSTAEDGALLSISGGNTIVLTDANSSNELNSSVTLEGTLLKITDPGGTLSADLAALQNDVDADPANELISSVVLNGTTLETTDAGGTTNTDLSSLVNDSDADPANELISSVVLNGTDLETTDAGGTTTTDLSSLVSDADADPANELISSVVLNGTDLETTDAGGTTTTDLSSLVDDADPDPANELISSVVLNGTTLETTDAGGTTSTDLSSLVSDADADPINEIQEISTDATPGNITITDGATLALNVDDADADPTNEIQNLQVIADTVFLTGSPNPTKILLGGRNSYGDIKHSFQLTDHDGWYKLDGRALTALPETAAQIASNFFTANLPNATDRFLKGNDGIEANGAVGGSNAITVAQTNLESFTLPVSETGAGRHNHGGVTSTNGNHSHSYEYGGSGVSGTTTSATTSASSKNFRSTTSSGSHAHSIDWEDLHTHNVSVSSGGSSTPIPKPSYLATNIFVYLGGTTLADLQALGQSNQEVLNSGISPLTIWSDNNAVLDDLLGLNFNGSTITLQTYVDQGIDLSFLYNQYKKSLLDNTSITTLDAYNAGVSINILTTDGSSVSDFQNDGLAIAIVNGSALFSLQELKDGNYAIVDLLTVSSLEPLLNDTDLTVQELRSAGVGAADFHGVAFAGGFIFDTQTDGTTYIAEDNDEVNGIIWAMDGSVSTGNGIGDGQANTTAIVAFDSGVNAATTCDSLTDPDGFSDWYLPSRSELENMYTNLKAKGFGNFTDAFYWSSSAASSSRAEAINFTDGQSATGPVDRERTNTHRVRAIRSFVSAAN